MGRAADRLQQEARPERDAPADRAVAADDPASTPAQGTGKSSDSYHAHQKRAAAKQGEAPVENGEGADSALQTAEAAAQALPGQAVGTAQVAQTPEADAVLAGKGTSTLHEQMGKAAHKLNAEATAQALNPDGVPKDPNAALQQAALENGKPEQTLKPSEVAARDGTPEGELDLNDLLRYSQAARKHGNLQAPQPAHLDEAANAAQRNQMLSQLGLTPATGKDGGDAALQTTAAQQTDQGAFWKDRLQSEANLLRNVRTSTMEQSTAPAASLAATQTGTVATARPAFFASGDGRGVENQVLNKVVQEAKWLIRNNQKEVQLKLNPEHLGDMHMKVTQKDGHMKVDMVVENHLVKHLIESNLADLRARLDTQNLGADAFQFSVDIRQGTDSQDADVFADAQNPAVPGVTGSDQSDEALQEVAMRPAWSANGLSLYA